MSVQIFISFLHKYEMRFHFCHVTKDDWSKPYQGVHLHSKLRQGDMREFTIGYNSLHFDWWGSPNGWSANSVSLYYPVRDKYTTTNVYYDHKHLWLPDLIGILHRKRFDKKMAVEDQRYRERQRIYGKDGGAEGLGALFG